MKPRLRQDLSSSGWKISGLTLLFLVLCTSPTHHVNANTQLSNTDRGESKGVIALTFEFDYCGDAALGSEWRRALRGLANECPLLFRDKQTFLESIAHSEEDYRNFLRANGQPPNVLFSGQSCSDLLALPATSVLRDRLALYKRGELSASD